MQKEVDSYRFISRLTRRVMKAWAAREIEISRETPWTPLKKPLSECRVALLSTAGIALKDDKPFDQEGERQNPWWGDPSLRTFPNTTTEKDVSIYHLHIDPSYAETDINCILPLQRLSEMVDVGEIGSSAPTHYSMMGYILQADELLTKTTPAIINQLKAEKVDVVLAVPV
ncbi:MAG: hypothetical protein DWQ04_26630 [Chloroflexi bacterium]|nr:MAG: hypothetical protein DWQ04_26630 [Chloroflexota bacterium]